MSAENRKKNPSIVKGHRPPLLRRPDSGTTGKGEKKKGGAQEKKRIHNKKDPGRGRHPQRTPNNGATQNHEGKGSQRGRRPLGSTFYLMSHGGDQEKRGRRTTQVENKREAIGTREL